MSEGALVNTGAARWPHPDTAFFAVQRMQTKLHRWAGENSSRCFGDLFNLVYDPAFLVHAFERVAGNAGAKTAGADGVTVAQIKAREGGELGFLARLRDLLKSGEYQPVEVRQVMIPKGSNTGKFRKLGIPTVTDRVVQASLKQCSSPSSRRISSRARTGSARTADRRTRSPRSTSCPPGAVIITGFWRPTSKPASTRSITRL